MVVASVFLYRSRSDSILIHNTSDGSFGDRYAIHIQLLGHFGTSVELSGLVVHFLDLFRPFLVLTFAFTLRAPKPLVIAATRNFQYMAHLLQSILGAVFMDERISYRRSFAKKCIAFFKISFSSWRSRICFCNSFSR